MTAAVVAPVLLCALALPPLVLGATLLLGRPLGGKALSAWGVLQSFALLLGAPALAAVAWGTPGDVVLPEVLRVGEWAWQPVLLVDRLSLAWLGLVAVVHPVIVRFSIAAMVREAGAPRYWFLVTLFALALAVIALAGNVDVLYLGWEVVGVCSVMLIAFFRSAVRSNWNSLRALVYYRVGDFLLMGAAISIHHAFPTARLSALSTEAVLPGAVAVALALVGAASVKSAQLPFSPWLHRAMEGPAASSGIFYGALSVHLGPWLLLRTAPLWMPHGSVRVAVAAMGLTTTVYAALVGRTRPDAKTALAYATMAQIGVMYLEVAAGLHVLAVVHLWAHAGLRTWQFLRSSSLLQDFQDNPLFREGVQRRRDGLSAQWGWVPSAWTDWLYLAASRQFWLDGLQWEWVGRPVTWFFGVLARVEDVLAGRRA